VVDVYGFDRRFSLLFVSEYEIDPAGEGPPNVLWLQRLSVDEYEESRIVATPRRELHVVHSELALLHDAKVET